MYSVRTQDVTIAPFCSVQNCLVTPVLLDSTFVSPFSHGCRRGGFQVVMRNLRMRRLHCATSVAPCCALVSAALALYRWLRPTTPSSVSFYSGLFLLILSPSHFRRVLRQRPFPPNPQLMFTSRAARFLAAFWRTSRDRHCRTVEWESSFGESGMRLVVKLLH